MATNPDLSALAAYAGTYQQWLFSKLYNSFDAANDLTLWTNVKNKTNLHKLIIKNGPKPGTGVFKPKSDDIGYQPRVLEVQPWQRDLQLTPSKYRQSFMAEMRGAGENPNNKTIPFAQYVWTAVLEQLAASINDRSVYFGVGKEAFANYNAGTAYVVSNKINFVGADGETGYFEAIANTTAGQSPLTNPEKWADRNAEAIMIGFGKLISNEIAIGAGAGGLDPVTTGVISSTSGAYDQFKKIFRSQTDAIKKNGAITYCSYTDYEFLTDDFESKVSKFTETDNGITYLSGTNRKNIIMPVTWLNGSRRLINTQKTNMIVATDILSDLNNIATEEHVYTLDAAMSGVIGAGIQDPEAMRVSDQA